MLKWLSRLVPRSPAPTDEADAPVVTSAATTKEASAAKASEDIAVGQAVAAFAPVNPLEEMLVAATTDPDLRSRFNQLLLESTLFVPTPEVPADHGDIRLEKGSQLRILSAPTPDGGSAPALFTAMSRIHDVFGAVGYLAMPAETILEMVGRDGVVINPGLPFGIHFTPAELDRLLGKPTPRPILTETRIMLGEPTHRPTALIDDLRRILLADHRISEAWLALAAWPPRDERSWFLDIRTSLARDEVKDMLKTVLRNAPFEGLPLDLRVEPANGEQGIGIRLAPAATH